jgi:hypothetical protein
VNPIRLDGTSVKFIAGASVNVKSSKPRDTSTTLRGLDAEIVSIPTIVTNVKTDDKTGGSYSEIVVPDIFPPGSVLVFATSMEGLPADLDEVCAKGSVEAFKELDLVELNSAIFRADGEERDAGEQGFAASLVSENRNDRSMFPLQLVETESMLFGGWTPSSIAACRDGWDRFNRSWPRTISVIHSALTSAKGPGRSTTFTPGLKSTLLAFLVPASRD